MNFNKIILGEDELKDFETLLLKEELIDKDISGYGVEEDVDEAKNAEIQYKDDLLRNIMLFDKIEATNISSYNLSKLIDVGLIDSNSCIIKGTETDHPTNQIINSMYDLYDEISEIICSKTDELFYSNGINVYSKNHVSYDDIIDLCDCFLHQTEDDFQSEYCRIIKKIYQDYIERDSEYYLRFFPNFVGDTLPAEVIDCDFIHKLHSHIQGYISLSNPYIIAYESYCRNLDEKYLTYNEFSKCKTCKKSWKKCLKGSEFLYNCSFDCDCREDLGAQRYAKLNGLIMSSNEKGTLFDNSVKFKYSKELPHIIDDIYYIVNVDMSSMLAGLPQPNSIYEALRLRNRDEIKSLRSIFLKWAENCYSGDIEEAEYIKKDYDLAINFFKNKQVQQEMNKSLAGCTFKALGNQIPYLSNLNGAISPYIQRSELIEEDKHKWFLLTR